ncbi:peptidase inhibitor family I36 protein, partial [Kitasatospora sp. NPDC054768]
MKSDENSTPIPQQTVQGNLPSPYADDTVVQAFAGAVDGMLAPVDPVLASMADNYQAFNAPAELLPYLVQVSGARVEPGWPERAVRAAIDLAGWLATHRGTPAGLLTEARIVYGWLLEIDDPGDVHLPGDSTQWPDHTPLYVTMEPRTTGKAPISYDQSTLERLVEAHIPASLTYQIVPSTDHIALYDDPYCTGRAWLVYSDTPDLQVLNADNRASSAWNRTSSVIALYKDTNFLGTNEFIQPNSKADQLNLDNQASSLRFLTNVPADAWGLYDQRGGANGSGQLIGVYHGTRTNLLNTAGGKAVSLVNNTSHTLQLFNADRSTFQMVYPGLTADLLDINLVHALDSVVDHATVPNGAYCLYEEVQQGGKSWLFWDDSDQPIDLTDPQIAAHPVCSVYNNTTRTLQLLNHTGDDQLFYPQAYNSVSTALNQTTTTATLYDG